MVNQIARLERMKSPVLSVVLLDISSAARGDVFQTQESVTELLTVDRVKMRSDNMNTFSNNLVKEILLLGSMFMRT